MLNLDLQTKRIQCPYCWETIKIVIDPSHLEPGEPQDYIEDCFVCCQPIRLIVSTDHDGYIEVDALTD
ncbi:CPXCG motif-containing cysteine-rich protein [Thiomicrorhabdus aquaedulcis]|uniref:CPXCG motif-containing cysteine-rich protein n=1 Tax=Thiomicrorhabdus aquaedulcis TaxID=2211106 RepID=UPI000FD99C69|nr:CPXCG motif-containing cysteine-rich protein [Thiomicrorhabdus aquaedulcis]